MREPIPTQCELYERRPPQYRAVQFTGDTSVDPGLVEEGGQWYYIGKIRQPVQLGAWIVYSDITEVAIMSPAEFHRR